MGVLDERGRLQGRIAAVVGGGSGIGEAITLSLAQAGCDIAFCDIKSDAVASTRAAVEKAGRAVLGAVADATDPTALSHFHRLVAERFGRLDVLVNVVGGVRQKPFMSASAAECAADIQRNYGYVLDSTRAAIPLIRRGGHGGSIINFATIEAHRGAAGFAVYAGAKAAVTNFSRALAVELGAERIRVNVIAPDTTPSEGNFLALPEDVREQMAGVPAEWMAEALRMYIPLEMPPTTDDLANAVLFLASDLSKCITGTTLHVDGGTWAASGFINWPESQGYLPVPLAAVQRRLFGQTDRSHS